MSSWLGSGSGTLGGAASSSARNPRTTSPVAAAGDMISKPLQGQLVGAPVGPAPSSASSASYGGTPYLGGVRPSPTSPSTKAAAERYPMPEYTPTTVHSGAKLIVDFPKIVHVNVGGHRFMTTIATLRADPNSMLGRMFSGEHPVLMDTDGSFVIDRDGRHFHHILNYLRDFSVPIGLSRVDRIELLKEVDYYGLKAMYQIVGGPTVAAAAMSGGGGPWLQSLTYELARAEAADFSMNTHSHRVYARLRHGSEYSGDWIVSSPRNMPNVEYELYDACLARDPITALNKMGAAGFRPCEDPPTVPSSAICHSDAWEIMMYKDVYQ